MNLRRAEWVERVSALALLGVSVICARWSHAQVGLAEVALTEREQQLESLAVWPRSAASGGKDFARLFADEEVVAVATTLGPALQLRAVAEGER